MFSFQNERLTHLVKQLLGKTKRTYVRKYCLKVVSSTGAICGIALDTFKIYLRTCGMNNINRVRHAAVQGLSQDVKNRPILSHNQRHQYSQFHQEAQPNNLLAKSY